MSAGRRLASLLVYGATFLVVSGWWFFLNVHWYGDPLAKTASENHLREILPGLIVNGGLADRMLHDVPNGIWSTFFYVSGWNQFSWSDGWYLPLWALLVSGLVGLVVRDVLRPEHDPVRAARGQLMTMRSNVVAV